MKIKKDFSISFSGISNTGLVYTEKQVSFGKFPTDSTDLYQPKGLLFIVADGMEGDPGGMEASRSAIDIISREYFSSGSNIIVSTLFSAFKTANLKIYQSCQNIPQFQRKGIKCSALILENNLAYIGHVGDTRIYRITDKNIELLTNEYTETEELFQKSALIQNEVKNSQAEIYFRQSPGH